MDHIAIIGATGIVGQELLKIIEDYGYPHNNIICLASQKSKYMRLKHWQIEALEEFDFSRTNIAFFAVDSDISKQYIPIAIEAGCICIDKSSYYRLNDAVPLVVPEINASKINNQKIIASPNCTITPVALAIDPLHKLFNVKKIIACTYQAVSGAGQKGIDALHNKKTFLVRDKDIEIDANIIPYIDDVLQNGATKEEEKMQLELKKILDADIELTATCVRVPVYCGHSIACYVECAQDFDTEIAINALKNTPSVVYHDYVLTPKDIAGTNEAYVSRLRVVNKNAFWLWIMCDNVRKGAALNAWQIYQRLK